MSADEELARFVRAALERGVPRAGIAQALRDAGWSGEEVRRSLDAYADIAFPVPVPRPRPYLSAREAFLYLLLFTGLYLSAFHLGAILFHVIERAFPDPAARFPEEARRNAIRWSVATLVVAFPLFVALSLRVQRGLERDPTQRRSRVRRWLTYLTLFLGAAVLLGDVIALVQGVLAGDLTTRFLLKTVVVAAIAGTAFGYYLWDLRQDEQGEGP